MERAKEHGEGQSSGSRLRPSPLNREANGAPDGPEPLMTLHPWEQEGQGLGSAPAFPTLHSVSCSLSNQGWVEGSPDHTVDFVALVGGWRGALGRRICIQGGLGKEWLRTKTPGNMGTEVDSCFALTPRDTPKLGQRHLFGAAWSLYKLAFRCVPAAASGMTGFGHPSPVQQTLCFTTVASCPRPEV